MVYILDYSSCIGNAELQFFADFTAPRIPATSKPPRGDMRGVVLMDSSVFLSPSCVGRTYMRIRRHISIGRWEIDAASQRKTDVAVRLYS